MLVLQVKLQIEVNLNLYTTDLLLLQLLRDLLIMDYPVI